MSNGLPALPVMRSVWRGGTCPKGIIRRAPQADHTHPTLGIREGQDGPGRAWRWRGSPAGCHASFWSAYQAAGGAGGRVNDALRARARGWALNFAIVFLAHSQDNPVLLEVGRRTLGTILEDQRGPVGE
jgi:hypothetical protein